ncbi:MAG: hypothetical protein NTV11_15980 [Rhodocyclales bacterium]|nr:hypothetical protein [Rhodocyclales bacterium]
MADVASLELLADEYGERHGRASFSDLKKLASEYVEARKMSILDAAAIAIAFDYVFSADTVDLSQITPDMAKAWDLAYPHVSIESLVGRSPEDLAGVISGWKGKLFEVEVEQRLNAGEWVGDLHLEGEQVAVLADSPIQAGWDLRIIDPDGSVADTIQLKATESVSYVHEALARYPDTPIVATHEIASRMAGDGIIDSNILNDHLTAGVSDHISDATSDAVSDSVMGVMPVSVIVATEAIKVLAGKKSVDEAFESGGERLVKGAIAGGVAAAVSVIGTPILGAIAGLLTRLALGGEDAPTQTAPAFVPPDSPRMQGTLKQLSDSARAVRRTYPCEYLIDIGTRTPSISEADEIRQMADDTTRLQIEQGSMPLASWIRMMARKNMEAMSEINFRRHLADIRKIDKEDWIKRAFPASGFFDAIAWGFSDEYQQFGNELNQALRIGWYLEKKLAGPLTETDKEELKLAKMSPSERSEYKARKQKRALIRRFLRDHPESIETWRTKYPEDFGSDGALLD